MEDSNSIFFRYCCCYCVFLLSMFLSFSMLFYTRYGNRKGVKKVFDSAKKSLTWDYKTTSGSLSGLLKNGVEWETRRKYLKDFANCVKYGTADAGILIDGFFAHSYTNQLREYYCCNTVTEMVIKEGIMKWID